MTVKARLECWCHSAKCDSPGSDPSAWVALTGCGHTFHEGCIKRWFKQSRNSKCPNCSNDNNIYAHSGTTKKRHPIQRLWLDLDDDRLHSSQPDHCHPPQHTPQPASGSNDSITDSVRNQLRETLNTLRTVKAERDQLGELPAQVAALQASQLALEADLENADQEAADLNVQIDYLEGRVSELEAGLPVTELAEARDVIAALEERHLELERERDELRRAKDEGENEAGRKEIAWKEEKARYLAQIKTSGNAGAKQIQHLRTELDEEQAAKLQVQVLLDRFELKAEAEAAKLAKAHAHAVKAAHEARDAALVSADQVLRREKTILAENARLRSANANYVNQHAKRKAKHTERTPEPEPAPAPNGLFSPRKALMGPYGFPSPRKPSTPPRPLRTFFSSDDDAGPPVVMNGVKLPSKRSAAQAAGIEDDCVRDPPAEEDGVLVISSDADEAPRPSPAFATLSGPRPSRVPWTAKLAKQLPAPVLSGQHKYPPGRGSSGLSISGPKIRHKLGKR